MKHIHTRRHESHFRYQQRLINFDGCWDSQFNTNKFRTGIRITILWKTLRNSKLICIELVNEKQVKARISFLYQQPLTNFDGCWDTQLNAYISNGDDNIEITLLENITPQIYGEWQNQFHTGIDNVTPQIDNHTPFGSDIINLESDIINSPPFFFSSLWTKIQILFPARVSWRETQLRHGHHEPSPSTGVCVSCRWPPAQNHTQRTSIFTFSEQTSNHEAFQAHMIVKSLSSRHLLSWKNWKF